jgi:hypothetical protein
MRMCSISQHLAATGWQVNVTFGALCVDAQVCREADGYQGHLVSPEFGLRRLIEDAMLLVLDPVVTAVHRVHLLLVEAAR